MAAMGVSEERVRAMQGELEKRLHDGWGGILKTESDEIATQLEAHVSEITTEPRSSTSRSSSTT